MNLSQLTLAVHDLLDREGVAHAFGGALALNLYADPRATRDVDVNLFVAWSERHERVQLFDEIGFRPEGSVDDAIPVAGVRMVSNETPYLLDLFFALDPSYETFRSRLVWHAFGPERRELPFFSADDIVLFKISFNRDQDWVDIRRVIQSGTPLDPEYIEEALLALRGPTMYPRLARLRAMIASGGADLG